MQRKIYQHIASRLQAMANCEKTGNTEWYAKHKDMITRLVDDYMPSGSGIDQGTAFDFDASKPNRLVFRTSYHHMTEGSYDGWTDHTVIVTPDLVLGFDLRITGRDRNDIKAYLAEIFSHTLDTLMDDAVLVAA